MLLIAIMTGPFEILFGTLNSSGGFGSWLMKILSYTIVYPLITIIVFMAHFFLAAAMPDWAVSGDWAESLAYNPAVDLIGDTTWSIPFSAFEMGGMKIVWMAVSYMLIIMIPKVFDIIKSFMERKPFDYGTAIGQSFGPVKTGVTGIGASVEASGNLPDWMANRFKGKVRNLWDKIGKDTRRSIGSTLKNMFGRN